MKKHGLTVDEKLTAYGYYVADSAKYHVPTFLGAGATAIICGNDLIASGVLAECKLRGFRVPEDISVIGFDDLPLSASLEPPLTTIRQERNELGKCAYVVLNSLVHHIPFCRTQIRSRLIERKSTALCQKGRLFWHRQCYLLQAPPPFSCLLLRCLQVEFSSLPRYQSFFRCQFFE